MKVLDTDTLTLFMQGRPRFKEHRMHETEEVVIAVMSRIEVLQGRFASLAKAANGEELIRGQHRLDQAERDLRAFRILPIIDAVAAEFDRLRQIKRLKRIGRGDLLIAAIVSVGSTTLPPEQRRIASSSPVLSVSADCFNFVRTGRRRASAISSAAQTRNSSPRPAATQMGVSHRD